MFKVGSLSFGPPVSASAVSKPIFEINYNEYKTKIFTPNFSVSGKNVLSFGSMSADERDLDIRIYEKGCNITIMIYY